MLTKKSHITAGLTLAVAATFALSACSGSTSSETMDEDMTEETTAPMEEDAMSDEMDPAAMLVGAGCADYAEAVPDGAGSVEGMAMDPVAVAASNNPLLTTLTAAVSGELNPDVNLVDTLNGDEFTVFAPVDDAFAQIDDDTIQTLSTDADLLTTILTYHVAAMPPPKGVDRVFDRSGFIHPMHAPAGGVVTGIHPDDHYHHLGLWHAWVKTEYNGKKGPDFWNLKARTGRVRHAGIKAVRAAGFTVAQEQVAYLDGPDVEPTVILAETLAVDAAFVKGANVIDYVLAQKNVSPKPLIFPAYRYGGGIAYRGPLSWNKTNSDYLTSKGLNRTNSHTSRARWVAMFGPTEKDGGKAATVAILCHPKNTGTSRFEPNLSYLKTSGCHFNSDPMLLRFDK